jgi:hypothetical protein
MLNIEPNPPARRSLRNRPHAYEDSPSGSTVPIPSIGSTPNPSPNDTPMEEWGTSVPYGAFFSSNPKSPTQKDGEEDDKEEEDNEGEEGDEEADEDYEAEVDEKGEVEEDDNSDVSD